MQPSQTFGTQLPGNVEPIPTQIAQGYTHTVKTTTYTGITNSGSTLQSIQTTPVVIEPGLGGQAKILPSQHVSDNTLGKGEFTFRPLEGRFTKDKDLIGKMDTYCKIKIGWHSGKTTVAKSQGVNPKWTDSIILPRKHNETFAKIKIKDKDTVLSDRLGEVKVNLDEVVAQGRVTRWFPVTKRDAITGEILMEITYSPIFMK